MQMMQIKAGEQVVEVLKQTWPVAKERPQKEEFQKQATFSDHCYPKPTPVLYLMEVKSLNV